MVLLFFSGTGMVTVGTTTTTVNREGICYSKEECEEAKGKAQGSCASGYDDDDDCLLIDRVYNYFFF